MELPRHDPPTANCSISWDWGWVTRVCCRKYWIICLTSGCALRYFSFSIRNLIYKQFINHQYNKLIGYSFLTFSCFNSSIVSPDNSWRAFDDIRMEKNFLLSIYLSVTGLAHGALSGKQMLWHLCLNVAISFSSLCHQVWHLLKVLFHFISLQFLL